jgi:hypothetical protein
MNMDARDAPEIAAEWLAKWSGPEPAAVAPGDCGDSVLDYELPRENPELCWRSILHVLSAIGPDLTDRRFAVLAAGPLEDLMCHHGSAFIDRVETEARSDPAFALLLGGVWRSDIEDNVWKRMQQVAKGGW